ncbi:hypothetical protein CNR22_10015 [Sphingobacteriaceae bacterium]|nr:hypothetical protein CNR22_10015 [Sphingobacteriaceae bacterium]
MRKLLILVTLLFSASFLKAQFSGTIEFRYANQKDTSLNIYSVKNKLVKLDQYGKKGNIEGSFLFDLAANEMKFLNPKRKLWGIQKSETPQVIRGTCVTKKGPATKTIAGVKCTEYTVSNTEENISITYWIAEGKYPFFAPMVKLWNKKDKQSIYFGQIKNLPEGSMPLLSEEKQLNDGTILTKLEVIKIVNTPPADAAFVIPEGYSKFNQ